MDKYNVPKVKAESNGTPINTFKQIFSITIKSNELKSLIKHPLDKTV